MLDRGLMSRNAIFGDINPSGGGCQWAVDVPPSHEQPNVMGFAQQNALGSLLSEGEPRVEFPGSRYAGSGLSLRGGPTGRRDVLFEQSAASCVYAYTTRSSGQFQGAGVEKFFRRRKRVVPLLQSRRMND